MTGQHGIQARASKHLMTKLSAMFISSCAALTGCQVGEDQHDQGEQQDAQLHAAQCPDWNLNARCDDYEQQQALTLDGSVGGPYIKRDSDKSLLTAPSGAQVITPMTTVINNELLFNPTLSSASETTPEVRALQAARYLEGIFPQVSFSQALYQAGPEEVSDAIQNSINAALQQQPDSNPYCVIAAVVDAMVVERRFDVRIATEDIASQCQQPEMILSRLNSQMGDQYSTLGRAPMADLVVAASFDERLIIWNNGQLLTQATQSQSNNSASTIQTRSLLRPLDDDDDDYDGHSGATVVDGGISLPPIDIDVGDRALSNISVIQPSSRTQSVYLINAGSLGSGSSRNIACPADSGSNAGVHKIQLGESSDGDADNSGTGSGTTAGTGSGTGNGTGIGSGAGADATDHAAGTSNAALQATVHKQMPNINYDAMGSATTFPTIPTEPSQPPVSNPTPGTDAFCANDAMQHLALSDDEQVLLAATAQRLFRLDMETLEQVGGYFAPYNRNASINHISSNDDGSLALVSSNEDQGLTLVAVNGMKQVGWSQESSLKAVKKAFFFDQDQRIALIEENGTELVILYAGNLAQPQTEQRINLQSGIKDMAISPDRSHLAVLTQNHALFLYQLPAIELIEHLSPVANSKKLALQDDQLLMLGDNGRVIRTLSYGQRFGNRMANALQALTLERILGANSDPNEVSDNLYLPSQLGSAVVSWHSNSMAINAQTGEVSSQYGRQAVTLTATVQGRFRQQFIEVKRSFRLFTAG
ncbi:hypothetical protein GCM10011297_19710 [Bacterioplanes sanyensis]|uniref:hypothetical protein n=1 Tax=Bacterioplanes sanyensis TaxID=1249553 RepID=UPI00167B76DB|nr:hypothetical protein [Bacterioplanes sanyensis]GGY46871.1 hypothetical protein GCM10011297_19710 [Bacterioplanes sanyensis]